VQSFVFSPSGDAIAFIADAAPGRQGDLWVAPLAGGAPERLGRRVGEPRWSPAGDRLAWLEGYDPRGRTGRLTVGAPGAKPVAVGENVSDFDLSPDGAVAFLHHVTAGGYSVDLALLRPGRDAAPAPVARGVFGFAFSPDGRWLYYRTACVREGEACDLYRVAVDDPGLAARGGGAAAPPAGARVAEGVKSFEFAPGRPGRLLVAWARKDRAALDLALWEEGKLTAVDTYALPGSVQFLGGDARRLAWAVVDPRRAGVYAADLP
jgi:Tol biopolymer transport system component